jgi:Tat protein secretion system quality control protein TatD with DNase activity
VDFYPHSARELAVFDEEIRLELFLGAVLSVPLDPVHLLFPEHVLEGNGRGRDGGLYLLGVPSSCAMAWMQSLQVESLFDDLTSHETTEDPLLRLAETYRLDQLEDVLHSLVEEGPGEGKDELPSPSLPIAAALRVGRVYLQSLLRRHARVVIGMGPIGLDYTDFHDEEAETEEETEQQQRVRWAQCLVLHLQLSVLVDRCREGAGRRCSEAEAWEAQELLPPPVDRSTEADGGGSSEGDSTEETETESEPPQDPLISLLSTNGETSAIPRYVLVSLAGPSSLVCRDLIAVLSSLGLPTRAGSGPFLLVQLSSASLTHRTIQYLLAASSGSGPSASPALFFTVDGRVTHSKQKLLREFVFDIPLERLVLESNGPLFPTVAQPFYSEHPLPPLPLPPPDHSPSTGGGRSRTRGLSLSPGYHPGHLLVIAATIASIKRLEETDAVLDILWTNTCRILGLGGSV